MLDLSQLFTLSYYLESNPAGDFPLGFFLLAFFGIMIFLPSFLRKIAAGNKYLKKSMKKGLGKFTFLGFLGLAFVLFRFAEVAGLSMRLWLYIIFTLSVVALGITLPRIYRDYQKRLGSVERERGS